MRIIYNVYAFNASNLLIVLVADSLIFSNHIQSYHLEIEIFVSCLYILYP